MGFDDNTVAKYRMSPVLLVKLYTIAMAMTTATENESAYHALRRLIIAGRYAPGTRLVEERLAQDLGVSRTPIRQALAQAAAEGLVRLYPNRGAFVRTFTRKDLVDAYDVRAVMEGFAAHQAAARITPEQLAMLEQIATVLEESLDQAFASRESEIHFLVEQNHVFHTTIIAASANAQLAHLLAIVVAVPLQFRSFAWYTLEERRVSNFFHRSIMQALAQRDAERARMLMQEHIYRGRDTLVQSLGVTEEPTDEPATIAPA